MKDKLFRANKYDTAVQGWSYSHFWQKNTLLYFQIMLYAGIHIELLLDNRTHIGACGMSDLAIPLWLSAMGAYESYGLCSHSA